MKQLYVMCVACILMFSSSIISAQDASEESVIVSEGPAISEDTSPQSQTETMTAPDAYAPVARPQPVWSQLIVLFLMFAFLAVVALIGVILWCRIYSKTGYGWGFGILMIIPVANFVMLCVLAFSEWPVLKEVKALRQQLQQRPPASL